MRLTPVRLVLATLGLAASVARAQDRGAAALGTLVDGLGISARVLVIGAHPDDEDTPLITFLSRGRHIRTAYLSLTRGEGGVNLVGPETGTALGVVRTAEVLAARQVDGAEQYFTRAYDFGLSKSYAETVTRWGAQEGPDAVLGDVVAIVRALRPHVIVTVYDGSPRDGHGQHQAAGRLARDVFAAALDTTRFSTAKFGRPWSAAKLYRILRADEPDSGAVVRVNVGEYAPALGRTWAELAAESRGRQRTLGGASPGALGASWTRLRLLASRVAPAAAPSAANTSSPGDEGAPADRSLFDGIDTTLARVRRPNGGPPAIPSKDGVAAPLAAAVESIGPAIARVRAAYHADDPSSALAPLAALVNVTARAAALAGSTVRGATYDADAARSLEDAWRRARDALVLASGVAVEATAERETVARATAADSSDTLRVGIAVYARGRVPVRVQMAYTTAGVPVARVRAEVDVPPDSAWRGTLATAPRFVTQPWWMFGGRIGELYAAVVDGRSEREMQESNESGAVRVTVRLGIAGADAVVTVPVVYRPTEPSRIAERPVQVVPAVTLRFDHASEYAGAGVPLARPMRVTLQSAYAAPREVQITLALPPGLTTDSATRRVTLPPGATGVLTYVLRGTPRSLAYEIDARAEVGPDAFQHGSGTLAYDHVPPQRIYFPASTTIRGVSVSFPPGAYVGYVAGPNDGIPLMLTELGLPVTQLDPNALAMPTADISRFTAIVVGPRAYETNPALLSANGRLFQFARAGGTVVVQYGQYLMEQPGVLPYPITLGRPPQLVTVESSPVTLLDPGARVFTTPNRIDGEDFVDWVQERAVFLPSMFDSHWRPALEVGDPGEPPSRGALLVAPVGRGAYVYTTLSFHRQLPAANPGAARLFVNLLGTRAGADRR